MSSGFVCDLFELKRKVFTHFYENSMVFLSEGTTERMAPCINYKLCHETRRKMARDIYATVLYMSQESSPENMLIHCQRRCQRCCQPKRVDTTIYYIFLWSRNTCVRQRRCCAPFLLQTALTKSILCFSWNVCLLALQKLIALYLLSFNAGKKHG